VAFSIRQVEDLNEITSHMLEVVQAHMALSKAPSGTVSLPSSSHNHGVLHPATGMSMTVGGTKSTNDSPVVSQMGGDPVGVGMNSNSMTGSWPEAMEGMGGGGYSGGKDIIANGLSPNQNQVTAHSHYGTVGIRS